MAGTATTDVFVSYSHNDETWVHDFLVPSLERSELKIRIDFRDFRAGEHSAVAMQEAVTSSQHTLVVLTPNWVDSEWSNFEGLLALTSDPTGKRRRVVPILLRDCEPPEWLKPITYIDFRDARLRASRMAKLLRDLGRPVEEVQKESAALASRLLGHLAELMHLPEVTRAVSISRQLFEAVDLKLDEVARLKRLHESFHRAHGAFSMVQLLRQSNSSAALWPLLRQQAHQLKGSLQALLDCAEKDFSATELLWTGHVAQLSTETLEAARDEDDDFLGDSLAELQRVFAHEPSMLNQELVTTARNVPLRALSTSLEDIREQIGGLDLSGPDAARLSGFAASVEQISGLDARLAAMVTNHDCLQKIDDELQWIRVIQTITARHVTRLWRRIQQAYKSLRLDFEAEWIAALIEAGDLLDDRIAEHEARAGEDQEAKLVEALNAFSGTETFAFSAADYDLHRFCGELDRLRETLQSIIGNMQR